MKKIVLITFSLLLVSCNISVQVFETKTENKNITALTNYTFEDDNVKLVYDFWSDRGLMSFEIYNKTDKSIYIDWSKSSFIFNNNKYDYWFDNEITLTKSKSVSNIKNPSKSMFLFTENNSISVTAKPEKITFIPPKSNFKSIKYKILPVEELIIKNYQNLEVPQLSNAKKAYIVQKKSFDKQNSPIIFRNFITYSFNENINSVLSIDNEFYISSVIKMKKSQFETFKYKNGSNFFERDENGKPVKINPYKDSKSFYSIIQP